MFTWDGDIRGVLTENSDTNILPAVPFFPAEPCLSCLSKILGLEPESQKIG